MIAPPIKRQVSEVLQRLGMFELTANRDWRRRQLMILCYHGVSMLDEHAWNGWLYIDRETFRQRLTLLRDEGYRVLPLAEALVRLEQGTLPPRAVAITFDDGTYDFYLYALPLLQEFGFPATLYLTTYYCYHQMPVFDPVCSYMIWKSQGKVLDLQGLIPSATGPETITDAAAAARIYRLFYTTVREQKLSAEQKDELLTVLAERLSFPLTPLRERRFIHIMSPDEVYRTAQAGISVELHTHRHRTPRDRSLFEREIVENRRAIQELTGASEPARHFCYPSGDYTPEFFPWLRDLNVLSATTCETGLARRSDDPMRLPRLLDEPQRSQVEFDAWLSGFNGLLRPRSS